MSDQETGKTQGRFAKFGAAVAQAAAGVEAAHQTRVEVRESHGKLVQTGDVGGTTVEIYEDAYVRVGMLGAAFAPFERLRSIEFRHISQDKSAGGRALAGALTLGVSYLTSNEKRLLSLTIATDKTVHALKSNSGAGFGRSEDNKLMALEAAGNAVLGTVRDATPMRVNIEGSEIAPAPSSSHPDLADQIRKLADLHAAGILTDDEFASKKSDLLGRM